ncbi:MAG: hypothetical protein H6722_23045 [Sandaracinus sp.]|nr:hypothetical protein [Sandaracinus sp.]MCB9615321.1 hypothetical protein [Sandaracinus sp.]
MNDACIASDTELWPMGACFDGVCRLADEGEECGPVVQCAEGTHCGIDGVCVPLGELGDTCGVCRDTLVCAAGSCAEPSRTEGGTCHLPSHCAAPARFCVEGVCSTNPNGATCMLDSDCGQGGGCRSGRCVQIVNVGEPCQLFFPDFYCPLDARCEDDVCRRQVLPTEACDATSLCPHGFACVDGGCVALPTQGEACTGDCATGVCRDGVCALGEPDGACRFAGFALPGSFGECEFGCEGTRCATAPSELGQPCRTCVEGAYCAPYPEGARCVDATCE